MPPPADLAFPDVIPADVRARLKSLHIGSRHAAGTQGFGLHRSTSRGTGMEFSQYRAYEPGDELRQVDWKLYARSDRFFVREAERDSPLDVWLLLDTSASMSQCDAARPGVSRPGVSRPGWSRLDAAVAIAACTIEIALRQGERFGLAAIGNDGLRLVPMGAGPRHRDCCVIELQKLTAAGAWPDEARLRPLWEHVTARSLVLSLGDVFDDGAAVLLERLATARREVLSVQLLTAEERDFPFRGGHRFRDPETGDELLADAGSVREAFVVRFAAAREALAARLAASGIRHVEYVLDEPLDLPLRRLFADKAGA